MATNMTFHCPLDGDMLADMSHGVFMCPCCGTRFIIYDTPWMMMRIQEESDGGNEK